MPLSQRIFGDSGQHPAARSIAEQSQVFGPEMDQALDRHLPLTGRRRSIILSTTAFLLNLVMFGAAMALLLISWGISGAELLGWAKALLFGFEIGTFRFSLLQLLLVAAPLQEEGGTAILLVTHYPRAAGAGSMRVHIEDGLVVEPVGA